MHVLSAHFQRGHRVCEHFVDAQVLSAHPSLCFFRSKAINVPLFELWSTDFDSGYVF